MQVKFNNGIVDSTPIASDNKESLNALVGSDEGLIQRRRVRLVLGLLLLLEHLGVLLRLLEQMPARGVDHFGVID